MDLNICLYCEKQLNEDNMNFCSTVCQTNEASKPVYNNNYTTSYSPSRLIASARSSSTTCPSYEIAYHRRLSFSYSTSPSSLSFYHYPMASSSSSSSASSSSSSSSAASTISTTTIHDSIKQQFSSWETSSNHQNHQHQQNVNTNYLF